VGELLDCSAAPGDVTPRPAAVRRPDRSAAQPSAHRRRRAARPQARSLPSSSPRRRPTWAGNPDSVR